MMQYWYKKVQTLLSIVILSLIAVFVLPNVSHAARIVVSPSAASVTQGKTLTVNVLVSSPEASMNAASGTITYPSDLLSVVSTSTSGSVLGQWLPPGASGPQKSAGSIKFEGVSLGGYQGTGGRLFSITFKGLKEGTAPVTVTTSTILANDGSGTDITAAPTNGQISIAAAPKEEEKPAPEPELPVVVPAPEPTAPIPVVQQPVVEQPVIPAPVQVQPVTIAWSQTMFFVLISLLLLFVIGMMGTWITLIHMSRRILFLEQMMVAKAVKPRRSRKKAVLDGTMPTI